MWESKTYAVSGGTKWQTRLGSLALTRVSYPIYSPAASNNIHNSQKHAMAKRRSLSSSDEDVYHVGSCKARQPT
jgi:hypothetical protein